MQRLTSERAHELGQRDAVLVGMEHSEADVHVVDPVDRDVAAAVDAEVALDVADGHGRLLAAVEADDTHALVVTERHHLRVTGGPTYVGASGATGATKSSTGQRLTYLALAVALPAQLDADGFERHALDLADRTRLADQVLQQEHMWSPVR